MALRNIFIKPKTMSVIPSWGLAGRGASREKNELFPGMPPNKDLCHTRTGPDRGGGRELMREERGQNIKMNTKNNGRRSHTLQWGQLPLIHAEWEKGANILAPYVNTYPNEELQAEGVIRNIHPFVRFLSVAGQIHGQTVNAQNIAREAKVARSTNDSSFSILLDTLLRHFLSGWRPVLKVREAAQPKIF
jgi:hypothetical protein